MRITATQGLQVLVLFHGPSTGITDYILLTAGNIKQAVADPPMHFPEMNRFW